MAKWIRLTLPQGENKWVNMDRVDWFDRAPKGGVCLLLRRPTGHHELAYFQETPEDVLRLIRGNGATSEAP